MNALLTRPYPSALRLTLVLAIATVYGCGGVSPFPDVYLPLAIDTVGGSGADGVVIADFDGDGDLDAASAWERSDRVRLHLQEGGAWHNYTIAEGSKVAGVEDVAVSDLDGDGVMEVIAACESGVLTWIRRNVTWSSELIGASATAGCDSWIDVEVADLNGDARPELVAACKGGGLVSVFYAADTPASGAAFMRVDLDTRSGRKASCVRPADLDEDGDLDIISAARNTSSNSIAWHENPGPQSAFTMPWSKHVIGHWPDPFWLDIGDVDGDGLADVAASSWENASYAWFRRPADVRDRWQLFPVGQFDGTRGAGITIADLDGDGATELVVGTYRRGRLAVFRPIDSAAGLWWPTTLARPGGRLDLVPVADVDGDGRLDIMTTVDADNGGVFLYRPWAR